MMFMLVRYIVGDWVNYVYKYRIKFYVFIVLFYKNKF